MNDINKNLETLKSRIQEIRKKHKLSQTEFGKNIGVSAMAISKYENGEGLPSIGILINIAKIYDCSTDWLLGLTTEDRLFINDSDYTYRDLFATLFKLESIVTGIDRLWDYVKINQEEDEYRDEFNIISSPCDFYSVSKITKEDYSKLVEQTNLFNSAYEEHLFIEDEEKFMDYHPLFQPHIYNEENDEIIYFNSGNAHSIYINGVFLDKYFEEWSKFRNLLKHNEISLRTYISWQNDFLERIQHISIIPKKEESDDFLGFLGPENNLPGYELVEIRNDMGDIIAFKAVKCEKED